MKNKIKTDLERGQIFGDHILSGLQIAQNSESDNMSLSIDLCKIFKDSKGLLEKYEDSRSIYVKSAIEIADSDTIQAISYLKEVTEMDNYICLLKRIKKGDKL